MSLAKFEAEALGMVPSDFALPTTATAGKAIDGSLNRPLLKKRFDDNLSPQHAYMLVPIYHWLREVGFPTGNSSSDDSGERTKGMSYNNQRYDLVAYIYFCSFITSILLPFMKTSCYYFTNWPQNYHFLKSKPVKISRHVDFQGRLFFRKVPENFCLLYAKSISVPLFRCSLLLENRLLLSSFP